MLFFKDRTENETGRLVQDFLKNTLYEVKAIGQHISFNIFLVDLVFDIK